MLGGAAGPRRIKFCGADLNPAFLLEFTPAQPRPVEPQSIHRPMREKKKCLLLFATGLGVICYAALL